LIERQSSLAAFCLFVYRQEVTLLMTSANKSCWKVEMQISDSTFKKRKSENRKTDIYEILR